MKHIEFSKKMSKSLDSIAESFSVYGRMDFLRSKEMPKCFVINAEIMPHLCLCTRFYKGTVAPSYKDDPLSRLF
jgi:hypothetical protein